MSEQQQYAHRIKALEDAHNRALQNDPKAWHRQMLQQYNSVYYSAPKTHMTSGSAVFCLREVHTGSYAVAAPNAVTWIEPKPEPAKPWRSPLGFGSRWRFDSPLAPLSKWFIRSIWAMRKALN